MGEAQELTPKSRVVEFKGEQGKIQRVNLSNLEAIFANVGKHNAEFSMGAMLAKGFSSHIRDERDDETSKPFSSEKDKRDTFAETLEIFHSDSLSPIGVSFTTSEKGATLMIQDEQIAETQIEFGIQNSNLFLSFLDALAQSKIDLNDGNISRLLREIGNHTASQIWRNYRYLDSSKDERIDLIAGRLGEIVSKFKELEIDGIQDLENYAKYAQKGILKEYVAAEDAMLFNKPKKQEGLKHGNKEWFEHNTLAAWWGDFNTSIVQHRWERAISILDQLRSNPKAKELMQEVRANLSDCISAALQDIDSKDENWDKENEWVKRKEKKEIFENARINIQMT